MDPRLEILVLTCDRYAPFWPIVAACWHAYWSDCPFRWRLLTNHARPAGYPHLCLDGDPGWNRNILKATEDMASPYVMLMGEDHFIAPERNGNKYSENMTRVCDTLDENPDVGAVGVGTFHPPELPWPAWMRLGEIDRTHHPFKRASPSCGKVFRVAFLRRLCAAVMESIGQGADVGRNGGINFEVEGTRLSENAAAFPERILACARHPGRELGLLEFIGGGWAVSGGKFASYDNPADRRQIEDALGYPVASIPGIAPWLP